MKIRNFNNFDLNENAQGGGNKFILMRFGNTPDPRVTKFFAEGAASRTPQPVAMKGPNSIMTIFESPLTKEALVQGFDALGISYNLYQVVHTSSGGAEPQLVARKPNKEQLEAQLKKAVDAENWEEAARLRDQIAELTGHPAPAAGTHESKVYSYQNFLYEKEEEEDFVNGTNSQEFYKLVSQLVDHEIKELETEKEPCITKEECEKIKDYLVQNKLYVEPEKKEEDKKEGEGAE